MSRAPRPRAAALPATFARLALVVVGAVGVACAPPTASNAGSAPLLLVLNAGDATLTRMPAAGGRPTGAVPVARGPWQLALGPGPSVVVLSAIGPAVGGLTAVSDSGAGWTSRPLSVEPGAVVDLIASDRQRMAAVYRVPEVGRPGTPGKTGRTRGGEQCRLALLDVERGAAGPGYTVCGPDEAALSLAVAASDTGGPIAYLGLWRTATASTPPSLSGPPGGRIVAVSLETGAVLKTASTGEIVSGLTVVPSDTGAAFRLLCACGAPDLESLGREDIRDTAWRWQVLELDAETLEPAKVYPLDARPYAIEPVGDGSAAYVLTGGLSVGARATVMYLDLAAGGSRRLAELPGRAAGLAIGAEYVYVPYLDGQEVWVIDRRSGRLVRRIPTGHAPVGVALSPGHQSGG